jgi:murein DD-endopeptidase MepM/ murein hydrolase activator NlpD
MTEEPTQSSTDTVDRAGAVDARPSLTFGSLAADAHAALASALEGTTPNPSRLSASLGRYGAHLAIVTVALAIGMTTRLQPLAEAARGSEPHPARAVAEALASPTPEINGWESYNASASARVVRHAQPQTTIPDRPRLEPITYIVEEGDSVFLIAQRFELSPYTIVWSNMESLQGAPWLLQPGLPLIIPPVDGAFHTVKLNEAPSTIAALYRVDASALFNAWNPIEPDQVLAEGTLLLIPGGTGPAFDWEPPPPPTPVPVAPARPAAAGVAQPPAQPVQPAANAVASGSFILPTGSYAVSGYVFGDYRNPRHIGLDYRCRMGDAIYAADGGSVAFVGWGGGYGNLVRLDHGNGFVTYYAHLTAFAVAIGQGVTQGQIVGTCGTTGASTGPHLHYEIRLNGAPQNPKLYEP